MCPNRHIHLGQAAGQILAPPLCFASDCFASDCTTWSEAAVIQAQSARKASDGTTWKPNTALCSQKNELVSSDEKGTMYKVAF